MREQKTNISCPVWIAFLEEALGCPEAEAIERLRMAFRLTGEQTTPDKPCEDA